jgi:hypothetical protein
LQAIHQIDGGETRAGLEIDRPDEVHSVETAVRTAVNIVPGQNDDGSKGGVWVGAADDDDPLVADAYRLDGEHWQRHQRPISPETLRRELRIGSRRARALVRAVRSRYQWGPAALVAA